ncbi:MAG: DUF1566 domain-containing protein [Arcobacteraceae bacterium]
MNYVLCILLLITSLSAQILQRDARQEIVRDHKNNLMWVDNESTITLQMTHKEALVYCEKLVHGGYSTWRVPTIEEFKTIVDKLNRKTHINKAFKYRIDSGYWAYKAHIRTFWYYADYMNFISGTAYFDNRKVNKYVRCVRDIK